MLHYWFFKSNLKVLHTFINSFSPKHSTCFLSILRASSTLLGTLIQNLWVVHQYSEFIFERMRPLNLMIYLTHQLNTSLFSVLLALAYSASSRGSEAFKYSSFTKEVDTPLHSSKRFLQHMFCLQCILPLLDAINTSLCSV